MGFELLGSRILRPDYSMPINRGLVGWWPFNEQMGGRALDISGKNNHGTLTSGVSWAGSMLKFPGSENRVITSGLAGGVSTDTATLTARFRCTSNPQNYAPILNEPNSGYKGIIFSGAGSNQVTCTWNSLQSEWDAATGLTVVLDVDYFVAAIISPTGIDIHLFGNDGTYKTYTISETVTASGTDANWQSGSESSVANRNLYGMVWSRRIHMRSLSLLEIQRLYVNPNAGLWTPDYARYYVAAGAAANNNSTRFIRIPGASMGMTRISGG